MVDTLKASEDGLKIVYQAGRKKGWRKTSVKWIEEGKTSEATIKRFWRKLAIDRLTFIDICQAVGVNWKEVAELSEIQEIELPVVSPVKDTPPIPNQNFIGRENAIAHLQTKINQGAKVILIQAAAGIGKTTLATEFLKNQNFDKILYLTMAKERETISPIETIVEEWLRKDFEEEP
ncbi:ATP-binding protein, partial [Planktothrix agardhii 1026]|nr:ATP-binding protein [Planktothrix agardhii 1026]